MTKTIKKDIYTYVREHYSAVTGNYYKTNSN